MDSASSQQGSLSDLPIGALSHVSSYLAPPSRALFAVALNYYRDIDSSPAIVGDQRDVLDFGDIEKELAVKLTDDDVRNILLSIDAVNNLKTLRLTNLLKITGMGLEPLRESTMIEKIDLSLVGDRESPDLSPTPPISCTEVLPILDSIIDTGGACSLKLLIFPKKWREERNTESEFHAFLVRYDALLRSRVVTCLKCNDNLSEEEDAMLRMDAGRQYGTQTATCHDCMRHFCLDCEVDEDGENVYCMSTLCGTCNRRYCLDCCRARLCASCNEEFCLECMDTKQCAQCDDIYCLNCISERVCHNNCCDGKNWCKSCDENCDAFVACRNCDTDYCVDCHDNPDNVYSDYCSYCHENLCQECRLIKCRERMGGSCAGCYRFAFPAQERQLQEKERQIQEMQAEINKLKRKVKDMNGELEDND